MAQRQFKYRCPRCRQSVTLYVRPSEPPVCPHEPDSGFRPEPMREVKAS